METDNKPKTDKNVVGVSFPKHVVEKIDKVAVEYGIARAAAVRMLTIQHLDHLEKEKRE